MGKRSSSKTSIAMLDSDDEDSMSLSSMSLDNMAEPTVDGMMEEKDSMLDECLDALFEKRGSTRENALKKITEAFNNNLHHDFVEKNFATLLHRCLNSIKKGPAKEVSLASHAIALLSLTSGPGEIGREILEESVYSVSEALKIRPEASTISSLLECLAIITFVGGEEPDQTEKSMQIMWQVAHPNLGPNVAVAKPSLAVITMVVSAWSFLLTTIRGRELNAKGWQDTISYLSNLLDKDDRQLRIVAGEALALIFETRSLEKFCGETKVSTDDEGNGSRKLTHIHRLMNQILKQMHDLSTEAGGKGTAKKDLNNQRNIFRDILAYIEDDYSPESSTRVGGGVLNTGTWAELIQLNFLKHFLGGGFAKHMKDNPLLHDVFDFMPNKMLSKNSLSGSAKRMYMSPNSALNKARTQALNRQRMLSQDINAGDFAVQTLIMT